MADTPRQQSLDTVSVSARQQFKNAMSYLFGRNALIGFASLMLLVISGYATWSGMNDFIVGVSTSPANQGRDLPGGLSVSNEALVIAIVVALTFLMWIALRETFRPNQQSRWFERLITFFLYGFLALWSIGFGYGFWWSLIAGEEATRTSMSALQEDARDAGSAIAARLDAVRVQLDSVVSWSETQMAREEASGGSCGTSSGAGRGPLYNARRGVRDQIANLRDSVVNSWVGPVQSNLDQLRRSVVGLEGATTAERQQTFEVLASDIRSRSKSIAARSNELGASTATEMRALAAAVKIAPGEAGFTCYDPTLAQRLEQAANQAAIQATVDLRNAAFNEGPAGVANAVKRLWSNIGTGIASVVAFIASGGVWPDGSDDTVGSITGRDLIALLATLGIDLGLFALTVLNPPSNILLSRPSDSVIRQVRDAITTAIKRAPNANIEWIRRHFVHHRDGAYFVVPNLYACDADDEERERGLAINQLAGVLFDLGLLRWPRRTKITRVEARERKGTVAAVEAPFWIRFNPLRGYPSNELKDLLAEELLDSDTDMATIRKERKAVLEKRGMQLPSEQASRIEDAIPNRNHGLFSKAERLLELAGWSKKAQSDPEIYRVSETRGLTPLLMILNDAGLDSMGSTADPSAVSEPRHPAKPASHNEA